MIETLHVYADANATLPTSPQHVVEVAAKLGAGAGNPSSPHEMGRKAQVLMTEARHAVAKAFQADVSEIIFVSGATEANNLGTVGVLRHFGEPLKNLHVVTSSIEHPSIRDPLEFLQRTEGLQVTWLAVDKNGFFSAKDVVSHIRPNTVLVTLMAANNELGTCEPVKEFCDWLQKVRWAKTFLDESVLSGVLEKSVTQHTLQKLHMHCDGVQTFGKLKPETWLSLGMDSVSTSAHKLGGFSGVGALLLRKGRKYQPVVLGGAQERSRRAGTENLLGIVSLGLLVEKVNQGVNWAAYEHVNRLRERLHQGLAGFGHVRINTPMVGCLPNTVHFSVLEGSPQKGDDLLMQLDMQGICASSGSACSSGTNKPSHVVLAIGGSAFEAKNSVRLSLGPTASEKDVDAILNALQKAFASK